MQIIITPEDLKKLSKSARNELMSIIGLAQDASPAKAKSHLVRKRHGANSSVHQDDIIDYLRTSPNGMSARELADRYYRSIPNASSRVSSALIFLSRKGLVDVVKDKARTSKRTGTPDRFYVRDAEMLQPSAR